MVVGRTTKSLDPEPVPKSKSLKISPFKEAKRHWFDYTRCSLAATLLGRIITILRQVHRRT